MIKPADTVRNFLQRDKRASLVIVKVDSRGNPDSVSYWKNRGRTVNKSPESAYAAGALLDIWT